ncbi:MAG: hypothetical protein RIR00_2297 [Pseudomonadota bacterium]
MSDYIRLCPTCGSENAPEIRRCACGALLLGVDLTLKEDVPATPAVASPTPTEAAADTAAETELRCPHEDCAQPNPPGTTLCLYCNRLLQTATDTPAAPTTSLVNLPAALKSRYRIQRPLPAGGAEAELLLVEPLGGGETLVAKIYRHGIHPKPEVQQRLAKIDPAHKVQLLEAGVSDGFAYELMEYCPAGSLRVLLQDGPLPTPQLQQLAVELAEALAAVHAVRLIHRDLKPENILIRRLQPLDLVLTDFGISSLQDATLRFTSTARTLSYGAPETIAGILDHKADYWSLVMILLEACLGSHPFSGLSDAVILHRLTTRPVDLAGVRDPALRKLLRGLLLRDPKTRWGADEFRRWQAQDPSLAEPQEQACALGAARPYRIGNEDCFTPEQLAVGMARHWSLAVADLDNGLLMNWLRNDLQDQNLVRLLIDINSERSQHADVRLLKLLTRLAPGLPPVWRGDSVGLGRVLNQAALALKGEPAAADWLCELRQQQVLETFAAAGNPESADLIDRWQAAQQDFDAAWREAEALVRQHRVRPGHADFDELMFGQHQGLKRPPPGLIHARLLALCYDDNWTQRLRQHVAAALLPLLPSCPWLKPLGDPLQGKPASLLVLHALLPEARSHAQAISERQAASRQAQVSQIHELQAEAGFALESLHRAATPTFLTPDACVELRAALEHYLQLLAKVRGLGLADENLQKLRARLARCEPMANRMQRLLDQLEERRTENSGWFSQQVLSAVFLTLFLISVLAGRKFFQFALTLPPLLAIWRLLPNFLVARQIRELGRQIG